MWDYVDLYKCNDGIERATAWGYYSENDKGLATGDMYLLENDYKKEKYRIMKIHFIAGYPLIDRIEVVAKEKDEVLTLDEFKKWLCNNVKIDGFTEYYS